MSNLLKGIYTPIIKDKGFNPSPIAGKIPKWADGEHNPSCIGTRLYEEFWEEQIYYCYNGYKTGGIWIPGKYYDYLNFTIIDGVASGKIYPHFADLHYEIFLEEDDIRRDLSCLGAVIPKARRKGLSFFGMQLFNYGMRYTDSYRAGIAAGLETYVTSFRSKLYRSYNNTNEEFRVNHLGKNKEEFVVGYDEETEQGFQRVENSTILFRTMQDDAAKFEGEFFHDVILEEAGEFPLAKQAIISIKPAMMDGENIHGKMWIYGTGGNMQKGGKTFSEIWHDAEELNLRRFYVSGERYYKPFIILSDQKHDKCKYLKAQYPDLSKEQLLGCEDIKAAAESLDAQEALLSKKGNKADLIRHKQNFPRKVEDVFTSSGSNDFNSDALYNQLFEVQNQEFSKWSSYVLEWKKDKNGNLLTPLEVYARPANESDPDYNIVKIYKHPEPIYKNLDIVGIDGYNEDKVKKSSSKSLGGIIVIRRNDALINDDTIEEPGRIPIAIYYDRPPRKEMHWDIGLKLSVYYGAKKNTMISAESDAVINYYKVMGGEKYLSPRPRSFDAPDSKQMHDYGAKMSSYSKPRMLSLIQSWIEDSYMYFWFIELINDLLSYDAANMGNDWDLSDAAGLALMRIEDIKKIPTKEEIDSKHDPFAITSFDYRGVKSNSSFDDNKNNQSCFDIFERKNL